MMPQIIGGVRIVKQQQQLKSQLLLVVFYFVLSQFHIKRPCFSLIFPAYVQFCTKISVLFLEPYRQPIFLDCLENLAYVLSGSLSNISQIYQQLINLND